MGNAAHDFPFPCVLRRSGAGAWPLDEARGTKRQTERRRAGPCLTLQGMSVGQTGTVSGHSLAAVTYSGVGDGCGGGGQRPKKKRLQYLKWTSNFRPL